jgi:hypothetical protein
VLPGEVFNAKVRRDLLHRVVRWQLAKRQQARRLPTKPRLIYNRAKALLHFGPWLHVLEPRNSRPDTKPRQPFDFYAALGDDSRLQSSRHPCPA